MIFKVFWTRNKTEPVSMGFVNAGNRYDAQAIAEKILDKSFCVTQVEYGALHQITPQSLTLNFPNRSEYKYFG